MTLTSQDVRVLAAVFVAGVASGHAVFTLLNANWLKAWIEGLVRSSDDLDADWPPRSREKIERLSLDRFPPLQNDLILRAALGKKTERVPVWCMRQAGRHMEEFRALRADHQFFKVCQTPSLAAEVTLQPLRRYKTLDACIIFSDILVIPQALGMEIEMVPKRGPVFTSPLSTPEDLSRLNLNPDIETTLGYVLDAINVTRSRIAGEVPLIGFSGAPFTLMCYMIEGGSSPTKSKVKRWLYNYPDESRRLLQVLSDVIVKYLIAQYKAGAQMLQVFETVAAAELTQDHFDQYCLPYLSEIAARVKAEVPKDVPLICFSKDTPYALEKLGDTAYDVIGLDWKVNPSDARTRVGTKSLQGNLDPCALYADENVLEDEVNKMLNRFGTQSYIANLGHGISPDHSPDKVKFFIDSVHRISEQLNKI